MRYVDLQSSGDERHHHGLRRYSAGHYLTEFSDAAIDAYLARGIAAGAPEPDWTLMPGGGFQAYGGAIADVGDEESAFSHRARSSSSSPAPPGRTRPRTRSGWQAPARGRPTLEPFSTGTYVNVMADRGCRCRPGLPRGPARPSRRAEAEVRP